MTARDSGGRFVRVTDHGADALLRNATGPQLKVRVGVYGEKAAAAHGDTTTGLVAEVHEFGLGNSPERSYLRSTVDDNAAAIQEATRRLAREVLAGRMTQRAALDQLGLFIAGKVRLKIASNIPPPVTAETQRRKGPSKTTALINTGQLRGSIDSEVIER
jgi:hypothetical protein